MTDTGPATGRGIRFTVYVQVTLPVMEGENVSESVPVALSVPVTITVAAVTSPSASWARCRTRVTSGSSRIVALPVTRRSSRTASCT
jgi:hypothetical protein